MAAKPKLPSDRDAARKAEQDAICTEIHALMRRADAAGMAITAYLLNMALAEERAPKRPPWLANLICEE